MIKYFNGRIELNECEKQELISVYSCGGRILKLQRNTANQYVLKVYTEKIGLENSYLLANIHGTTAAAVAQIILADADMENLSKVITKYC